MVKSPLHHSLQHRFQDLHPGEKQPTNEPCPRVTSFCETRPLISSKGPTNLHPTPLIFWSICPLLFWRTAKTCYNPYECLGNFSRSFSVIFDTLWLIRSLSTGNCSWRPLINAPVPGQGTARAAGCKIWTNQASPSQLRHVRSWWIPQKLRLLNYRPTKMPPSSRKLTLSAWGFGIFRDSATSRRKDIEETRVRVLKLPTRIGEIHHKMSWIIWFSEWFTPFFNVHGERFSK